ncbi:MAG: nucleotide-binding protein [Chloroflexi bacterium]|nr:nucleotide-binding protein [Chloroflexota bacterium]
MIIRNLHGKESKYLTDLKNINFVGYYSSTKEEEKRDWQSGKDQLRNLFITLRDEISLFSKESKDPNKRVTKNEANDSIFLVHGHDEKIKQSVARVIEKLGLKPVILHEQPNLGRTVIEKFTDYSKVGFAIVLLTPDDMGYSVNAGLETAKYRARQNVILELGYFLGTLGRERVIVLHSEADNFEIPSDYSGVLFLPFDSRGRWQLDFVKELRACGYNVDANKLI